MLMNTIYVLALFFAACNASLVTQDIRAENVTGNREIFFSPANLYTNPVIQENAIITSIYQLTLDLSAEQWQKGKSGNVVMSPVSIGALLNMILLGVRGDTYRELKKALHYSDDIPDAIIHESYQKVLGSIPQQSSEVQAIISSRMFMNVGSSIIGTYSQVAQALYNSTVQLLDFTKSPSEAMDTVNKWVLKTTFGKIENFISTPFSPDTKLVAINTVYFNGGWEYPFSEALTFEGNFDTGVENISIPIMTNLLTVPYLKGNKTVFDMIALPYKGRKYSMYIITPTSGVKGIKPLQLLENSLDFSIINSLINQMEPTKVSVNIPRMKLSNKMYLKDDLKSLGVQTLFDSKKADFGRLTTDTGIYLNDVVHEAILEVTETGTVAAAATAGSIDRIGSDNFFSLNRPSLLFIRDNKNGLTLFWARVVKPEPIV